MNVIFPEVPNHSNFLTTDGFFRFCFHIYFDKSCRFHHTSPFWSFVYGWLWVITALLKVLNSCSRAYMWRMWGVDVLGASEFSGARISKNRAWNAERRLTNLIYICEQTAVLLDWPFRSCCREALASASVCVVTGAWTTIISPSMSAFPSAIPNISAAVCLHISKTMISWWIYTKQRKENEKRRLNCSSNIIY